MNRANPVKSTYIVLAINFFEGKTGVSWSSSFYRFTGRATKDKLAKPILSVGNHCLLDTELIELVELYEALGAEIKVSRYKNGEWTRDKPLRYYRRFRSLLEKGSS